MSRKMRVLVCGSRTFNDRKKMEDVLGQREISTIIHGMARGADTLAGEYARVHDIPVLEFPALWDKHGRSAGPIRNQQMLREGNPELVIAFLGPNGRGTQNMIDEARKAGVEVQIVDVP